jgi:hypothetical protein
MEQAKNVAQGFIAAATAICLLDTWGLLTFYFNPWLGYALFLLLAVPFTINFSLATQRFLSKKSTQAKVKQAKNILMALQGFGFACWFFDLLSTVFVIDIKHASYELNPLGWPLSAVGALVYFVPITFIAYYLLFKLKSKVSFYSTVVLTGVSIFMGLRNLVASLYNLPKISPFLSQMEDFQIIGIWIAISIVLMILNCVSIIKSRKGRTGNL